MVTVKYFDGQICFSVLWNDSLLYCKNTETTFKTTIILNICPLYALIMQKKFVKRKFWLKDSEWQAAVQSEIGLREEENNRNSF